jgi:hypothetical protein
MFVIIIYSLTNIIINGHVENDASLPPSFDVAVHIQVLWSCVVDFLDRTGFNGWIYRFELDTGRADRPKAAPHLPSIRSQPALGSLPALPYPPSGAVQFYQNRALATKLLRAENNLREFLILEHPPLRQVRKKLEPHTPLASCDLAAILILNG